MRNNRFCRQSLRINITIPDATIMLLPASIIAFTGSLKIKTESPNANIKRVYLNGATIAISPARVAKTTARYAPDPAETAVISSIRSFAAMDRKGLKKGIVAIPARNEAKKAQNEIVMAGMDTDIARVIVSLKARKRTAAIASNADGLKVSRPG